MKANIQAFSLVVAMVVGGAHPAIAQEDPVRVGTFTGANPFTFYDETTGTARGAGAEIIQAISEEAGLAIEWVPIEGSGSNPFVEAIEADRIDVISYPFQRTEARQAQYDFTDPIFTYGETIVVHKDDTREYRGAADLAGVSVGVVEGSNFVDIANAAGADTRVGESLPNAMKGVDAGELQAAMGTAPVVIYVVGEGEMPNLRIPEEYRSEAPLPAGFGVKKGNTELLAALNDGLDTLADEGAIAEIAGRWDLQELVAE
jgi:polar amino acid transport system substrate-binding protein